jgi:hypothetical protein
MMKEKIGACDYVECSALNGCNLKTVFETAINNARNCEKEKIKQFHPYQDADSEADCRVFCHVS